MAWAFTRLSSWAFGDASNDVDDVNCPRFLCIIRNYNTEKLTIMKISKILSIAILIVMATTIIACSGDDGNGNGNGSSNSGNIKAQLIGVWKTSMTNYDWKYIKLEANGKMLFAGSVKELKELISNTSANSTKAFWSYNGSDNTISMYTEGGYYAYTYKVNMAADGKSWAGYDSSNSSKTYTFIKINDIDNYDDDETD